MITHLDHIQLAMPPNKEDEARKFFINILKMKEEMKPPPLDSRGGCWFRTGTTIIHLGVEKPFVPQKKAHPAFITHDLDQLAIQLHAQGYEVIWDDALPNRNRFYTSDPFGNRLEFIRNGDGFTQK